MGPGSSAVSDTARAPKKKVLTLKERVESPYFEDYSCPWLQDVWIQLRDNCEKAKKIREAIATATPASMKSFHFLWNIFLSCVENADTLSQLMMMLLLCNLWNFSQLWLQGIQKE